MDQKNHKCVLFVNTEKAEHANTEILHKDTKKYESRYQFGTAFSVCSLYYTLNIMVLTKLQPKRTNLSTHHYMVHIFYIENF